MAHLHFLELFTSEEAVGTGPLAEDLPGYAEGFAAGMAAAAADTNRLNAQMVDKFTEFRFGYAEARQELLNALAPFIDSLCDHILPDILDDLTRSKLFETLLFAAQSDLATPITLTFHPRNAQLVADLCNDAQDFDLKVVTDPDLEESEFLVGTPRQETQLDVSALVKELSAALRKIQTPSEGMTDE